MSKPKSEFHLFTQKNTDQNGRQMCDRCVGLAVACRAAAKANARLARTRAKWEAARKQKVLTEVQAEIARVVAARKQGGQSDGGTVPTTKGSKGEVQGGQSDAGTVPGTKGRAGEVKRKAEQAAAVAENGSPSTRETQTETRNGRHTYTCPFCAGCVESIIATGRIDHRHVCGHQFTVENGVVNVRTQKQHSSDRVSHRYRCPFCDGTTESTVSTGCIDHRKVCGHQFRVQNGSVSLRAQAQRSSSTASHRYRCPFCDCTVESTVSTGRVDHRQICGHRFMVENGVVKVQRWAHQCPTCGTVVQSKKQTGRMQCSHKNASGQPCEQKEWVIKSNNSPI